MINLYIDESGTMNCEKGDKFIISIVRVLDNKSLKVKFKRCISKYIDDLKECDKKQKMFKNGKFIELKGCALSLPVKKNIADYLSKSRDFEVYIIELDNKKIDSKLYKDRSRAFNYMIKLALEFFINKGFFNKHEEYRIIIDERNVKVEAKRSLDDYLNTSLQLDEKLTDEIQVEYHDSAQERFIQIADFFANFYYSQCVNGKYDDDFKKLSKTKILRRVFKFPLN